MRPYWLGGPARAAAAGLAILIVAACGGGPGPGDTPPGAAGTPDGSGPVIDLSTAQPITTIWGADSDDFRSDLPGLTSGDFNGDGRDDLLIGARFGDGPENSRQDAGEAYVIFGAEEPPQRIDLAEDEADVTIWGAAPDDNLGLFVHSGDVNGDGTPDILVGAPFAAGVEDTPPKTGAVYVFFGSSDLKERVDLAQEGADLTLFGPGSLSFFGDSLATGDVNDDGVGDIIVGSTFANVQGPGSGQTGAVYVVFGSNRLSGTRDMAQGEYDLIVIGADPSDELGDAVATGDVNGDGVDDLLMIAEAADGPEGDRPAAGEIYVKFGSPDLKGSVDTGKGEQDVLIFGADASDILGFSIASGDVDGDGIDDIVAAARTGDGAHNAIQDAGQVYLILGSSELPATTDLAQDEGIASFVGADSGDLMAAVTLIDIDGDGDQELITSTGYGDGPANGRRDAGEAIVLNPNDLTGTVSVQSDFRLQVIYGASSTDRLGAAVASGDFDGDGRPELILLAMEAAGPDASRPNAGKIYVVRSGPLAP